MHFINNDDQNISALKSRKRVALFFYKDSSEISHKAIETLKTVSKELSHLPFYAIDLEKIDYLHADYEVKHVPTLVLVEEGKAVSWVMGAQKKDFYLKALGEAHRTWTRSSSDTKPAYPRVTVYSTPTCSYCTMIKNHLRKHNVPYKDIDVCRDRKAAEKLVQKTGQMGVPQTFIGGTHIMGFDKSRINQLLGLRED